jgi:hypothetical protein
VRYADDCNIYVRSQRAGERVMAGIEKFLAKRPQAEGQQGQECGCQTERPQVPGLQLYEWKRATAAHRAAGDRPSGRLATTSVRLPGHSADLPR